MKHLCFKISTQHANLGPHAYWFLWNCPPTMLIWDHTAIRATRVLRHSVSSRNYCLSFPSRPDQKAESTSFRFSIPRSPFIEVTYIWICAYLAVYAFLFEKDLAWKKVFIDLSFKNRRQSCQTVSFDYRNCRNDYFLDFSSCTAFTHIFNLRAAGLPGPRSATQPSY